MIVHEPYGIDDPYKRAATERFPRDPAPGDHVSVGFATESDAREAWLDLDEPSGSRRVSAASLGQGLWLAELGELGAGSYSYTLHAQGNGRVEATASPFPFEIGAWHEAGRVTDVASAPAHLALTLDAQGVDACAVFTFPLAGVCRIDLATGPGGDAPPEGLPCELQRDGSRLTLSAPGTHVSIDTETLEVHVRLPGAHAGFRGSLRHRWKVCAAGHVDTLEAEFTVRPEEWLYGLGERFGEANRRGRTWDVRVYEEYKEQGDRTYLPVPFLVSNDAYGLWLAVEEPSHFDLASDRCTLTAQQLGAPHMSVPLHVIVGEQPYDVTAAFTRLTGEIAVPPRWAFGPWMSANTWNDQASATRALSRTVAEDVPATVIVLEAWSDESTFYVFNDAAYEPKAGDAVHGADDFRFGGRWPDPRAFVEACHEAGVRVLLWQIPVHKPLDEPHPQHDADEAIMLERGYAILEADGTPYRNVGWWFPGALVLDVTNPEALAWWFAKRRYLFDDLGIDGMKTDGGEHLWGRSLRSHDGRRGLSLVNTYALLYTEAYHAFVQEATGGDGVIFSRAGYTGAQRFPAHWAGDEDSTWSAYRASVRAGLSAGVSGVSMWSWDLGGFSGEIPSPELYLRSTAMATFCPIMQYHSEGHGASECRDRTPWNVAERHGDERVLPTYRRYAQLRMRLQDLVWDDASALAAQGVPLMRYPALAYPEAHDFLAHDPFAYLFGRDLLVAPVMEKGALTRAVRLPPGEWIDLWSGAAFTGSRIVTVPAPLDRIPAFVRAESPRRERLLAAAAG